MSALRSWSGALFLGAALACTLSGAGAERTEAPATALATFREHLKANHRAPPASCARVDAQALEEEPSVEGLSHNAAGWVRDQHARTRGLSRSCFAALDDEFGDATWGTPCVLRRVGPPRNRTLFVDLEAKAAAVLRAHQDPACALARDALAPDLRAACAADAAWQLASALKACTVFGHSERLAAPEWEDLWWAWLARRCAEMPQAMRQANHYWACESTTHCPLPRPPPPYLHQKQLADWAARRGSPGAMSCYGWNARGMRGELWGSNRFFRPEFILQLRAAWAAGVDDEEEMEMIDRYELKGLLTSEEADREFDRMYQDARSVLEQMAAVDPASALAQLAFFEIMQRPYVVYDLQWRLPESDRVRRQQRSLAFLLAAETMDDGRLLDNLRERRWERLATYHLLTPDNLPAAQRAADRIVAKVRNGQRPEL